MSFRIQRYTTFFKSILHHPVQTGAIAPSSKYLAKKMVVGLNLKTANCVVELGPGTGAFTRKIISELKPHTTFFAIERNPVLVNFLNQEFPNIEVFCDTAENLAIYVESRNLQADCIFSGLPLSWLPKQIGNRVLDAVYDSLRPGGEFAMFQYLHASLTPMGMWVQRALKDRFKKVNISVSFLNIPPAIVIKCEK